jgi:hypothetical protein
MLRHRDKFIFTLQAQGKQFTSGIALNVISNTGSGNPSNITKANTLFYAPCRRKRFLDTINVSGHTGSSDMAHEAISRLLG